MTRLNSLGWLALLCTGSAAAAPIAVNRLASSARATVIVAPPLQRTERDPCWRTDRPGTIDEAAMAPVVEGVLDAVRRAATQPGGLEAVEIEVIGESDRCPARAALHRMVSPEVADYLVDVLAVETRTRIVRRYLVEQLARGIGAAPATYGLDPAIRSLDIAATLELIVRATPRGGDIPIPSTYAGTASHRRFAIVVHAPRPPVTLGTEPPPPDSPQGEPTRPPPHEVPGAAPTVIAPRPSGNTGTLAVGAVAMTALGTSHFGGQIAWTRPPPWRFGPPWISGGIRLAMLASDEEWANGGRLASSTTLMVGVPVLAFFRLHGLRLRAGMVASAFIGLAAARGDLEIGVHRELTQTLALGIMGGPALTLASSDTNYFGWSAAISLERSTP